MSSKILRTLLSCLFCLVMSGQTAMAKVNKKFIAIQGTSLIDQKGKPFYIVGTNLGNWLNPEGYMFGFQKTNCEWMINEMVCELFGPDRAREFWQSFKDNYITEADIAFISQTGVNTIRLPFNYKLFFQCTWARLSITQTSGKPIS